MDIETPRKGGPTLSPPNITIDCTVEFVAGMLIGMCITAVMVLTVLRPLVFGD